MHIEASPSPDERYLLSQFRDVSYQVLESAMARYTGKSMNPALDGKPVNLLQFNVDRTHPATIQEFEPNPIEREMLGVCVQRPMHLRLFSKYTLFDKLSPEEKETQQQVVMTADAARLQQNFSLSSYVPRLATWAGYTANRLQRVEDGVSTDLAVSTYELPKTEDELERMVALSSALFFARDALAYVGSFKFEQLPSERVPGGMRHRMHFIMTPALGPFLNGHESSAFLKEYQVKMQSEYKTACDFLTFLEKTNQQPDAEMVDWHKQCEEALWRVNDLLARRGE